MLRILHTIEATGCDKVCPIKNQKKEIVDKKIESYAIRCIDHENLKNSTSGGFFLPLAKYIIEKDGMVYGVAFDKVDKKIKHICVNKKNISSLEDLRGSKYVQSCLGEKTFKKIENNLNDGALILFSGTPCQIEGLLHFLQKDYPNLITLDLICHGVPSPRLWNEYIKYQEKIFNSEIIDINFRNKTYGYHSGTMKISFQNGKEYYGSARVDYLLKPFFKEISSRPSCYKCAFKKIHHCSDFTIFDSWNASKLNDKIIDDDKGFTNLFINSEKGVNIFNNIKAEYIVYKTNKNEAIRLDGVMVNNSATPNSKRDQFYKEINKIGLEKTINKFIKVTIKDKTIEKNKNKLYKIGILQKLKKIKEKIR